MEIYEDSEEEGLDGEDFLGGFHTAIASVGILFFSFLFCFVASFGGAMCADCCEGKSNLFAEFPISGISIEGEKYSKNSGEQSDLFHF